MVWIAIAFWPARVAGQEGNSFIGYFIFSLFFFPAVLLAAYLVHDRTQVPASLGPALAVSLVPAVDGWVSGAGRPLSSVHLLNPAVGAPGIPSPPGVNSCALAHGGARRSSSPIRCSHHGSFGKRTSILCSISSGSIRGISLDTMSKSGTDQLISEKRSAAGRTRRRRRHGHLVPPRHLWPLAVQLERDDAEQARPHHEPALDERLGDTGEAERNGSG
jgi:hypothetical protein